MPKDTLTATGSTYHPGVGMIMVFNLIIGTGALALPHAFQEAGWLISSIMLCAIALIAFITATYVVEAMAIGNAVIYLRKRREEAALEDGSSVLADGDESDPENMDERSPMRRTASATSNDRSPSALPTSPLDVMQWSPFEIRNRVELGRLSTIFFGRIGQALFYLSMAIYLYGDLAIYATAVPTSLLRVSCTYLGANVTSGSTNCSASSANLTMDDPCWEGVYLTRFDVYRIYVAAFALCLGPFAFFNVQKTMLIQIVTTVLRWVSLLAMISLACMILTSPGGGHGRPPVAEISAVPQLFGSAVYAFMCHHSLPSLITPIRQKRRVNFLLAGDFIIVLLFYLLLAITGVFAFHHLEDLYTLNFRPGFCDDGPNTSPAPAPTWLQYFIALFPVFTISASFPIIAITLRNNIHAFVLALLSTLRRRRNRGEGSLLISSDVDYGTGSTNALIEPAPAVAPPPLRPPDRHKLPVWVERFVFPLVALLPPVALALITDNVSFLVSITGSYAGAFVQYLIPAALVYYGRKRLAALVKLLPQAGPSVTHNPHRSPFGHWVWLVLVTTWAVVAIGLVTVDHVVTGK